MAHDPRTPEQWQEAADAASFMLHVHSAEAYGFITGPEVNVGRCEDILERARSRGVVPRAIRELLRR